MSALGVQEGESPAAVSTFGTKDPILAATLGNLGFRAKHSLPVLLIVSAASVINLVDKKTGRVSDCAHLEFRFEAAVMHEIFGRLSASVVSLAHEIAKLTQKEQTKEISGSEALTLETLRKRWASVRIGSNGNNYSGNLLWAVQLAYDQVTNFLVVSSVTKELARNPLIEFSRQLQRGTAYAVEPAESEPQAQRRVEKLFRNS